MACRSSGEEPSAFRTDQRVKWTTSRIQGTPDPPDPYRLTVAFPKLRFQSPIDLVSIPGLERLAVVEHRRGISTFSLDEPQRADLLLDTKQLGTLFAAAFHPRFAETGWVFFSFSEADGMRLARVKCSLSDGIPRADPASLKVVYRWPSGGHTGGCVRFGPDGLLYLATGDGSGHSDTNEYAQDITDPRGAILRFDVDRADGDRLYSVPADNPFAERAEAAREVFAYGLRQPWKMSFDARGRLWAGDVGQDLWEMVHLIRKGGNYGWSITEGSHPFRPERRRGPTPIVPPVVEHHHTEFRSITGGHVYRSPRLAELQGAYIYGDFDTGRIWMLRYRNEQVVGHQPLVGSRVRVVGFGQDHRGEVYVVGYASGRIYRFEKNSTDPAAQPPFPRKLSETGLFASTRDHTMAAGIVPYSINAPAFADGARVERYLGLPGDGQIERDALLYPRGPHAPPGWRFPDGTVLVQTLSMPRAGSADGTQPRRIETRILHHQRMPGSDDEYGAQIWNGYSYVWNEQQTDAELADAAGLKQRLTIVDPDTGEREQRTWRVPSRSECTVCHNIAAKHVIGMNTMQINRGHAYGANEENQLEVFQRLQLFSQPLSESPDELPRITDYRDRQEELGKRARAYLHANCSHCHRQWGGGNSSFQLMATMPLEEMKIVAAAPAHGTFGIDGAKVVAPGAPDRSAMLYRLLSIGSARMPRLGSSTVDAAGAQLIHDWIAGLPSPDGELASPLPSELTGPGASDRRRELIASWLGDTSKAMRLVRAIDNTQVDSTVRQLIIAEASSSGDSVVRDLFDRYLPEARRLKRLGEDIDAREILAIDGNATRGEALFFRAKSLQCKNCHQIRGQGTALGPELTKIAAMNSRTQILESILDPSKDIKPEYRTVIVQTTDGRAVSGIRVPSTGEDVVLKNAKNEQVRIAAGDIQRQQTQMKSIMPDAQVRSLTAQQLADLVAYLATLK